jgi:hypothetical protein
VDRDRDRWQYGCKNLSLCVEDGECRQCTDSSRPPPNIPVAAVAGSIQWMWERLPNHASYTSGGDIRPSVLPYSLRFTVHRSRPNTSVTPTFAYSTYTKQRCGSVTFWYGSGSADPDQRIRISGSVSADPYLWLKDLDLDPHPAADPAPDPATFVSYLQDGNLKFLCLKVYWLLLFEATFTSFLKDQSHKEVTNDKTVEIKVFLTIFGRL